jgi:TPR repeat protein
MPRYATLWRYHIAMTDPALHWIPLPTLVLLAAALQPAPSQAQPAQPALDAATVTVNARKQALEDPRNIAAARSRVLSRKLASSCGFMSSYNANEDDVALRYMRDFNLEDSLSNPAERFDENSPQGDVARIKDATPVPDPAPADDPRAAAVQCGPRDRNFAAGRNRIERKDKSLTQAFAAIDRQDYRAALALLNTAYTKVGSLEAALMLGKLHLSGLGTPRDPALAQAWLNKVTDARYHPVEDRLQFDPGAPELQNARVEAAMLLAKMYLTGTGVQRDPVAANRWYARAADYGFVPATSLLGLAAWTGFGGPKNAVLAHDRLKEAAEAGYVPAQYHLARLYYAGAEGVPQDYRQAGARLFDLGHGVASDQQRAIGLYKDAAVKGNADAQNALATYFYEGQLVKQDYATARSLFNAAATQGQADAMFNLAVMLLEGQGGAQDTAMAYVWLNLAQASGHANAAAALAEVAPRLNAQDRARAGAIFQPSSVR